MADKSQKGDDRARNWTFIVYPESAPENWVEVLEDLHVQWVESPLHDKDFNGDGSPKKPHKHIGLFFDGKKTYEQVCEVAQAVNGTIPKRTLNARSLVRYFAHLDNPEKAQYSAAEVVAHGGIDLQSILAPSSAERHEIVKAMMTYCEENDITEFSDLCVIAMQEHADDWFPVLVDHNTIVMQTYLTSRRHKLHGN